MWADKQCNFIRKLFGWENKKLLLSDIKKKCISIKKIQLKQSIKFNSYPLKGFVS